MVDLDAIKARCEAAKPGPWYLGGAWIDLDDVDLEFCVHAREDIPALVAEVEQLRLALNQALAAIAAEMAALLR